MHRSRILFQWFTVVSGSLLLGAAALVSNAAIERALLSDAEKNLAWGPALFRALLALHGLLLILTGVLSGRWQRSTQTAIASTTEEAADNSRPTTRPFGIVALILCAVALGLRLWRLDSELWLDEILMVVNYTSLSVGDILATFDSQNHHMLYTLLARLAISLFGESTWTLRLPAVVFGVGSVWALYLFAREVTNQREAILAAALMALSYHHIWFSQNARGYTGLLCCTLLSSWLLLRGLREPNRGLGVWYALIVAMGMWIHLTMVFVIGGHFLIYLWKMARTGRENWQPLLLGFSLSLLFTLQLYALVLPQVLGGVLTENHVEASKVGLWKNPVWAAVEILRGLQVGYAALIGAVVVIALFVVGILGYWRDKVMVVLLLFLPVAIGGAVVVGTRHPVWPRLFFFTLGFVCLALIRGASLVGEKLTAPAHLGRAFGTVVPLLLIGLSAASIPAVYGPKQNYQGALHYVEGSRRPGDRVVTIGVATVPYLRYYNMPWDSADTLDQFNTLCDAQHHTWVLYTIPLHLDTERAELKKKVDDEFDVVKSFEGTLAGGTVYVVRSKL